MDMHQTFAIKQKNMYKNNPFQRKGTSDFWSSNKRGYNDKLNMFPPAKKKRNKAC